MVLFAQLSGGAAHGRRVEMPLEALPDAIEWVTEFGRVPYQRVGHTAEYRPATVLGSLQARLSPPAGTKKPKKSNGFKPTTETTTEPNNGVEQTAQQPAQQAAQLPVGPTFSASQ